MRETLEERELERRGRSCTSFRARIRTTQIKDLPLFVLAQAYSSELIVCETILGQYTHDIATDVPVPKSR